MRACVEAALCQAIPLAIDLITRLIGINVGKRVKDIVARISKKIRGVIDRLINKLNRTKPGQKFTQATGKKIPTFEKLERSKKVEKAKKKDTRRVREREASLSDNKIAAAAASMGNRGTQLSDYVSDRKKAQSNKVFNVTGLTGALKGEKEGDLGVNLDNSKYVTTTSERNAQKIDQYFENRKAEKLRLAELEAQKKRIAETPENEDNDEGAVEATTELSSLKGVESEFQRASNATDEKSLSFVGDLIPGTPEHKQKRWEEYIERGGRYNYLRWSKQYDVNMRNCKYGLEREKEYRRKMNAETGRLKTPYTIRQIDILKSDSMYAGQLKTGYVSYTKDNKLAIEKDRYLVELGWEVEHILEKGASSNYIKALEDAHIKYTIK